MYNFKHFQDFIETYPENISPEYLPEKTLKKIAKEIDKPYSDFLREHGVAGYDNGFTWSVNPYEFTDVIAAWGLNKKTDYVIARTAFGDLFVWTGSMVMLVHVNFNKKTPSTDAIGKIYDLALTDRGIFGNMTFADHYDEALKKLGPVSHDECYGFFPALPLGGEDNVNSLQITQLKPYLEMLAEVQL